MREYYGEDVWIDACFENVDAHRLSFSDPDNIPAVITDTRQLNEAERLKAAGYVLIRVEAPEALRIHRAVTSGDRFNLRDLTHGTETALDDYSADFTVVNDAGLPEPVRAD